MNMLRPCRRHGCERYTEGYNFCCGNCRWFPWGCCTDNLIHSHRCDRDSLEFGASGMLGQRQGGIDQCFSYRTLESAANPHCLPGRDRYDLQPCRRNGCERYTYGYNFCCGNCRRFPREGYVGNLIHSHTCDRECLGFASSGMLELRQGSAGSRNAHVCLVQRSLVSGSRTGSSISLNSEGTIQPLSTTAISSAGHSNRLYTLVSCGQKGDLFRSLKRQMHTSFLRYCIDATVLNDVVDGIRGGPPGTEEVTKKRVRKQSRYGAILRETVAECLRTGLVVVACNWGCHRSVVVVEDAYQAMLLLAPDVSVEKYHTFLEGWTDELRNRLLALEK